MTDRDHMNGMVIVDAERSDTAHAMAAGMAETDTVTDTETETETDMATAGTVDVVMDILAPVQIREAGMGDDAHVVAAGVSAIPIHLIVVQAVMADTAMVPRTRCVDHRLRNTLRVGCTLAEPIAPVALRSNQLWWCMLQAPVHRHQAQSGSE